MSPNNKKTKNIPAFLLKIYSILEDNTNQCAIIWSPNGIGFLILNQQILTQKILPKYFKHSNYSSFIRQLNMYDFHKIRKSNMENYFHHDQFIKGDLNSLSQIKRKPQKKKTNKKITYQNLNQAQRFFSQTQLRQQKIMKNKALNKTEVTLNSVHTIKPKSQESIILVKDNVNVYWKDQQIYYEECESGQREKLNRVNLNQSNFFNNEEQMDDDSSKMSINDNIGSKNLIENHQKEILIPSLNNIFTFFNPYQVGNFGLFL